MGSREPAPLRSVPRAFVAGVPEELPERILLPEEDDKKFRNVLRLKSGDEVAILPGDGRLVRATLDGHSVRPVETVWPDTEPRRRLTLCLAMPKNDKLDESVRLGSEIGVATFVLFPSDRTVVKWDEKKREHRLRRLRAIAREAAEVSFRTRLPGIGLMLSLAEVLESYPNAQVLSEVEKVDAKMRTADEMTLVIGPEGGWSPREVEQIGERAVTLGERVLRVDTAVASACALALLGDR
ncbi:MAG TPA: RsmE family RNA methyltransferase [Fimbriimonadaceae bacterium]|nr:RsmE family RNA methyltransferase [Fimbriimonadaceae bacterium]